MDNKALDEVIANFNTFDGSQIPPWASLIIEGMKVLTHQIKNLNTLSDRLQKLEEFRNVNEAVTSALQNDNARLKEVIVSLEEKIDDIEQRNRNQCLLIHGVPEEGDASTDDLTLGVINGHLELQDISIEKIQRTHRVGPKREQRSTRSNTLKPRPIIVRFLNYRDRQRVYKNKRKLKGKGITISENLTSSRYRLFMEAIDKLGRDKTWTMDGRITTIVNNKYEIIMKKNDLERIVVT